uniref:Uncharacterized protein n=1 Tax=Panagrellus redivivus TaxID=6233 RepID=A0A7E4UMT4_PANRE
MPPDPYAVIVLSLLLGSSTIAVGLVGSGVILLTGCLKRKHSQKRAAGKTGTANTDISGEAAEINSSGGAVKSGGTPGSGVASTPAKPIKSITPVAVTPDKPGGSANSKTNHRVKGSHKVSF